MMRKIKIILPLIMLTIILQGCKVSYSFTGANIGNAKTFQVNNFLNNASFVEPSAAREFTVQLQDLIINQTSLGITNNSGDLTYEGEIVQYYTAPITATAQSTAAQNRLTIAINVRFFNVLDDTKDFEERFSFYVDYDGNAQLIGSALDDAHNEIFERITQDVFNKSLADW